MSRPDDATQGPPDVYEIRVRGVLDTSWSAWFDGLEVTSDQAGQTRIAGPVVDQAALHGLLTKVRDLRLPLVSVRCFNADEEPTGEVSMTRASHRQTRAAVVAGYAAAAWALLFAVPHLYWGVGGVVGLDTALNREIVAHRSGWFLALNWGIGLFCLAGGLVALATVRTWGRRLPARLLRGLAWLGFVLLAARVLDIYVEFGLGLTGIRPVPADQRDEYLRLARWFLFLWLPWFTLGAVAWGALTSRLPRPMPPRGNAPPPARPHHR